MENSKVRVGIVGGAGYTGGEALRLLLNHAGVEIVFVHSRSNAGSLVADVHKDLYGDTELRFTSEFVAVDLLFLCLGHGESKTFLSNYSLSGEKIIDLSQDYRLKPSSLGGVDFVYGLPEVYAADIRQAQYIANPGCFATALQLALAPLAAEGLLDEVHVTGITGSTGAGQKLQPTSHFSWRANNIEAYKTLNHQHLAEVCQTLNGLQQKEIQLNFVPWRGDFTRGIYLTAYMECSLTHEQAYAMYSNYYEQAPFTVVSNSMVNMKQVVNTNKCLLHLERVGDKIAIHATIDNLLKGASGQAVQNMNLMFGLPEDMGLKLKANSF